jgi:hypothetical protein
MRLSLLAGLLAIATLSSGTGCTDLGVGRRCLFTGEVKGTQITTPALECMSKICYLKGDDMDALRPIRSVCSARCTSDSDCGGGLLGSDKGLCNSSFVCAVAQVVPTGTVPDFACQALCICKDDLDSQNMDSTSHVPCCPTACRGKCPANLANCS